MNDINSERRIYPRYDTELKVFFHKEYDIKTRVIFKVISSIRKNINAHRHSGLSKNISAEGLCFISHNKLTEGDLLNLILYPPTSTTPVKMEGEVRWFKEIPGNPGGKSLFLTGVKLLKVNSKSVNDSIHFDQKYNVIWSVVLDALFHDFAGIDIVKNFKKYNHPQE